MTKRKVKKLAEKLNAELHNIHYQPDGSREIEVSAPKGYLFNANDGTNLLCIYYPDFGETAKECYKMIYEDLQEGLREMTQEQKINYGYQ